MNSGDDPGEHEDEPRTCCSPNSARIASGLIAPTSSGIGPYSSIGPAQDWSSIHGPATTITTTRPRIFGMKESVCSWICVTAWKTETDEAEHEADEQERQRDLHARAPSPVT